MKKRASGTTGPSVSHLADAFPDFYPRYSSPLPPLGIKVGFGYSQRLRKRPDIAMTGPL
jgi:hypothetical protein